MALIAGLRDVGSWQANERPESWRERIAFDFPAGPNGLVAMLAFMEQEDANDSNGHYWTKDLTDRVLYINNGAGYNEAATSLTIDDGSGGAIAKSVVKNTVLFNASTREIMRVSADPSSTTVIVVERAAAGSTAAAITDNDRLIVMSQVHPSAGLAPTSVYQEPSQIDFYTQIFKESYTLDRRGAKTKSRTGNQLQQHRREAFERIALGMEMASFFGRPHTETDAETGTEKTYAGGILDHVVTNGPAANYTASQTTMTLTQLNTHLENAFAKVGSGELLACCGNTTVSVINNLAFANSTMNIEPGQELFGIAVNRWVTPFGDILLYRSPLLTTVGESGSMFLIDTTQIKEHVMDPLDLVEGAEPNDADYIKDYFMADLGWEWGLASHHYIVRGITAAA